MKELIVKYRKVSLTTVGLILGLAVNAQQSIQFTQYIFNSLSVNPAYAGYKEEWFAQTGLRSQWTGWSGAPKTGTISIDGTLDPNSNRHGIGLNVTGDRLGAQSATSVYFNYALRLQLDREDTQRLSFGIAGGVSQYSLDGNRLNPNQIGDGAIPDGKISSWVPDIRLGIYYYNPIWYAGVSVQDLFQDANSTSDYRFNVHSETNLYRNISGYFIAGALFELDRDLYLRPSLLLKEDFRGPTVVDVNTMLVFNNKFWIGAGYRSGLNVFDRKYNRLTASLLSVQNAVTGIAQIYITEKFRVGYSYDAMINRLSGLQNGTHEVTMGFSLGKKTSRYYKSPRFF